MSLKPEVYRLGLRAYELEHRRKGLLHSPGDCCGVCGFGWRLVIWSDESPPSIASNNCLRCFAAPPIQLLLGLATDA